MTPLAPDELERAIVRPASSVGQTVEPALVAQVASDVAEQPGALPLVQYALTELFDRRQEGRLTLEAYREIGGVGGALAASAEHLFETRQLGGRDAVRELFLSLVTLGEGTPDTRRRVRLSELSRAETDPAAMESALDAYGRHRLLTFDRDPATREPTVEVAHEALLGAWDRLRGWIDEARDDIRVRNTLASAAADWEAADRDESFLLRGARLERVASWAETTTVSPSAGEAAYLRASVERRDEERAAEAERQARERALERRSIRRLRGSSRPSRRPPWWRASSRRSPSISAAKPGRGGAGARRGDRPARPAPRRPVARRGGPRPLAPARPPGGRDRRLTPDPRLPARRAPAAAPMRWGSCTGPACSKQPPSAPTGRRWR